VANETVKQQIEQRIRDYRRVTIDEIAIEFNMCHGSVYNIVHNDPGYRKVCSRWVPRQLSDDHKRARQKIYQEHLDRHAREGDAFLQRIVTGDESWVYHQRVRDNRYSGSTRRLRPTKIQDTGFRRESHADRLLGCQWPYIGALPGKGSNCDQCSMQCHASERVEASDTIEMLGTSLKKSTVASRQHPPPYGCAHSGYTMFSEI
jgi:hypothetical protein